MTHDQCRANVADSRGWLCPVCHWAWYHKIEQRSSRRKSRGWFFFFPSRVVYGILPPGPVIVWIELGGKPKWLPLNFGLSGVIGLASATSQLDRNAWQRVATYNSGSKQTWRRIFFVWNHIEKAQTDRTPAQLPLCWAATARFILSSFFRFRLLAIFQVSAPRLRFVEPCRSVYNQSIAALKNTRRGQASRFLGLFFVWWTCYRSF